MDAHIALNCADRIIDALCSSADKEDYFLTSRSRSEARQALMACKSALIGVGVFSAMINILMLTGAFYMLQIYDRVLTSGSIPTLIVLSALAFFLLLIMGVLDLIRSRILVRVGASLDQKLSPRIFNILIKQRLRNISDGDGLQSMRDLDFVRSFLASPGPTAFYDMPWVPIYIGIIFAFHFLLGITAVICAAILIVMALMTEYFTRRPTSQGTKFGQSRNQIAHSSRQNAEVLTAMGMNGRLAGTWQSANESYIEQQINIADVIGGFGAISKAIRMILQSGMLGMGAYLVINQQASSGVIIAGAIVSGRALAPIDQAIGQWQGFVAARHSWTRLKNVLFSTPETSPPMALQAPSKSLSVEKITSATMGASKPILQNIGFRIKAGHSLGIIGPSASGKSSLARLLVGAWQPVSGKICLDDTPITQWNSEALGQSIGYVPQDVELFAGTIAQNIGRFDPDATPEDIIDAAEEAGVHSMIANFPNGYDTKLGEQGLLLSAGQKQRIALARALYGKPFLVVLDEPNSNLDVEGEKALVEAVDRVRDRQGIIILIAHRAGALTNMNFLMVLKEGMIVDHGPRKDVLARTQMTPMTMAKPTQLGSQKDPHP